MKIPAEYLEALGDILGNYGTIEFADQSIQVSKRRANAQRTRNENIYRAINKSIQKIGNDSTSVKRINLWCQRRIDRILNNDLFQDDRFGYKVNNAFLFRYRSYSEKYFILKKALIHQKTIHRFLEALEKAPANSIDFEKYILAL
jgi:hypothetical protein